MMSQHIDPSMISIEGNIGAGKSTFLKIIARTLSVQPVFEPHAKWQSIAGGENLLDKFYTDPQRWAYTFQTYAFVTRVFEQEKSAKTSTLRHHIVERSVYSDRYCFAKNAFEMGMMTPLEWSLYQEWFGWLVEGYTKKPRGFIYLRVDPAVCYARLVKRNRSEEQAVSLDYLTKIHEKHERWLIEKKDIMHGLADVPVLVLDCNRDFESNSDEQMNHAARIRDFFQIQNREGIHSNTERNNECSL
jgi:deoxyadenosine/deoxycytidine kinase